MRLPPLAARAGYAVVVLFATLTGLALDPDPGDAAQRLARAMHPTVTARDVVDGVRNLLLFAGLGATWVATSPPGRWWRAALPATLAGALLSACVEGAQLFSPVRVASLLDVATNGAGALAGALATGVVMTAFTARRGARSYLGIPAFAFGAAYAGAVLCEAFSPLFRGAAVPNAWGGPGRRFAVALAASRTMPLDVPLLDVALFAPAGALVVASLAELGFGLGAAAGWTVTMGAALVGLVELARGLSGQRMETGAFAAHVVGLAIGALLAWRLLPAATRRLRGAARVRALGAVYLLVLALWAWRPFRLDLSGPTLTAEFAAEHFIPLYALGARGDLFSAADVATQFLLYFPLGALAAVWPLARRGAWRGPVPAIVAALVLETAQLVVAERFFDVTDWLVQGAGALVGWSVAWRAGFRPRGTLLVATGAPAAPVAPNPHPERRIS
jgi:VanZ family protein